MLAAGAAAVSGRRLEGVERLSADGAGGPFEQGELATAGGAEAERGRGEEGLGAPETGGGQQEVQQAARDAAGGGSV